MPRLARRTPTEIGLLAAEIREHRSFTGSVRGWLRDNLALIEGLQAGTWQPTRVPSAPPAFVQPRRWPMADIRVALIEGGVRYQNGLLSLHTLNSELRDLRRELALAQAIGEGRLDTVGRRGGRAAPATRFPNQTELLDRDNREPQRPSDPPRPESGPPFRVDPAPQGKGAALEGDPNADPDVAEMRRAMARAKARPVQPVQPVVFTHEDRRAGTKKEGE